MSTSSSTQDQTLPTWPQLLTMLISGRNLSAEDSRWAMNTIMEGAASDVQIASFLTALRAKGETVAELTGLVEAMLDNARSIEIAGPALDIVGTGGDRLNTVNISTMSALVCAGAGARIVKHGNRAASSSSGSADVLEALGVRLDLPVEGVARAVESAGITFCFAQMFHPSMRFAAAARSQLGVATAFNFLGPLINPAHVEASAVGVADPVMAPLMAGVFAARGSRALVFRGDDGLDEMTTTGSSRVWEVRNGSVTEQIFDPATIGIKRATVEDLRGANAAHNAEVVRRVLNGETGPVHDAVVLNAAAGLVAFDESADGSLDERMVAAAVRARQSIFEGAAARTLQKWIEATA